MSGAVTFQCCGQYTIRTCFTASRKAWREDGKGSLASCEALLYDGVKPHWGIDYCCKKNVELSSMIKIARIYFNLLHCFITLDILMLVFLVVPPNSAAFQSPTWASQYLIKSTAKSTN